MDYCIRSARTESGTCSLDDKIYLVGGYSWKYRERINDVECVDISSISPRFRGHYSTAKRHIEESPVGSIELQKNTDTTDFFDREPSAVKSSIVEQLADYPLHCTGIACASVTLYKKINFPPFSEETEALHILNSEKTNGFNSSVNEYKRFDGAVPRTAAAGLSCRSRNENFAVGMLESKIDTLRSIGFQGTEIKPVPRPASTIPRMTQDMNFDGTLLPTSSTEDSINEDIIKRNGHVTSSCRFKTTTRNSNDDVNNIPLLQELRLGAFYYMF